MPELPEVETMCRGIRPIIGSIIQDVSRPPCHCRPCLIQPGVTALNRRLHGRTITDIGRRGKRVLIFLDDDSRVVIEPRMTGLVLLADPPDVDHMRLKIQLKTTKANRSGTPSELLVWDRRGLGTIRWMSATQFQKQVDDRLGIDALEITSAQLREKLRSSRRAIKVALLDQKAVAGIGNLYAAEILFLAGVDPRTRCDKLTVKQFDRIHVAIGEVLQLAILHEGSTLSDGTYRNALNDPGNYQNMHRVYDREGETCQRCGGGVVRRIVQAQRSTFFCPICQRRTGVHETVDTE